MKLEGIEDMLVANVGTDLGLDNRNELTLDVTSSTGTEVTIPAATESLAGLMTADDKKKLNDSVTATDIGMGQITLLDQLGLVVGTFNVNQKNSEVITINTGGGASVFVGTLTEVESEYPFPGGRPEGTLWWNTEDGTMYIWYEDADSSQWVVVVPGGGGVR